MKKVKIANEQLYVDREPLETSNTESYAQYKVYTKEDYRRYILSSSEPYTSLSDVNTFNEVWDKLGKGYKFIIVLETLDDLHIFSVDYFNNEML